MDDEGPRYIFWSGGGVLLGVLLGLLAVSTGTPACSLNPAVRSARGDIATLPEVPETIKKDRLAQAQRGWYLTTVAGCAACHTPIDPVTGPLATEALSGGQLMRSRFFGSLYTANLTSDRSSGLGKVKDEHARMRAALRGGFSTRGNNMHPAAMPWHLIGQADTEDLECMLYYLTHAKAVSRTFPARAAPTDKDPQGVWMGLGSWRRGR